MTRVFRSTAKRGDKTAMRSALGNVFMPMDQSQGKVVPIRPQAAPAKADKFAPDPQRRVMVAKIKIAQKALDFDDGDYRALLDRVTGKTSTTAMSIRQLGEVLDEFKRLGWQPVASAKVAPGKPKPADHPAAKKARALLISLGLLGVIRNTSESSLEAFARRQMGVERLQWADQAQVYKLIEALKKIAERNGWEQSVAGLDDPIWTLKLRLCEAILKRLKAAGCASPETSIAAVAIAQLGKGGAVMALTERDLEMIAAHLGGTLARHNSSAASARAADRHYED